MLLSAVSVLVVAQSSSEIPDGIMNNPLCKQKAASCTVSYIVQLKVLCNIIAVQVRVTLIFQIREVDTK